MKKLNNSYIFIAILLIAAVSYRFFFKSKPLEIPKYGNYLSCIGNPFDLRIKVKSEMYLVENAMPESIEAQNKLIWGAVFYQNLYSFTNILDNNPNSPLKWSTLSSTDPKITILSQEKTTYPYDVEMDEEPDLIGFRPVAVNYLKKLLAMKKISKGDSARKIIYEYEADLFTCFIEKQSAEAFKTLKFPQPVDPYTAYFTFPKTHRVLLKNPGRYGEGVFNPCLNPDSITAGGFNPFSFWYFWRPEASGHGADKVPFDCSLFYKVGHSIQYPDVKFVENNPIKSKYIDFAHFEKLQRPVRMSVLVGGMESKVYQKLDKEGVEKYIKLYLSGIDAVEVRKNIPTQYDAHFTKILILLWKISSHMIISDIKLASDELSLDLLIRGKLKLSKKDIELKVTLAPNSPLYPGADIFAKNFADDFLTSDIVSYEGHAATGSAFDLGLKLLKESNYSQQDRSLQYQVFAIYSCSSSFYYHPGNFPKNSNPAFKRDVLRTAGSYADGSSNGTLALMASLDQYLYNESYVPFAFWAKKFKSDNFYILTNH